MQLKLTHNIWKSDEKGLGFFCINTFSSSVKNPNLEELLKAHILNSAEFRTIQEIEKEVRVISTENYGAIIIDKIEKSDFKELDYVQLISEIEKFCQDENWGEDLEVFKKNFKNAIFCFSDDDLKKRKFYYLNTEELNSEKIANPNFFTYLICFISTSTEDNEVVCFTFGAD